MLSSGTPRPYQIPGVARRRAAAVARADGTTARSATRSLVRRSTLQAPPAAGLGRGVQPVAAPGGRALLLAIDARPRSG